MLNRLNRAAAWLNSNTADKLFLFHFKADELKAFECYEQPWNSDYISHRTDIFFLSSSVTSGDLMRSCSREVSFLKRKCRGQRSLFPLRGQSNTASHVWGLKIRCCFLISSPAAGASDDTDHTTWSEAVDFCFFFFYFVQKWKCYKELWLFVALQTKTENKKFLQIKELKSWRKLVFWTVGCY